MNRAPGFPNPGAQHPGNPAQPRPNSAPASQTYPAQAPYQHGYPAHPQPQAPQAPAYPSASHDPQQGWTDDPHARWAPAAAHPGQGVPQPHQPQPAAYQPPQYHMPQGDDRSPESSLQRLRAPAREAAPAAHHPSYPGQGGHPFAAAAPQGLYNARQPAPFTSDPGPSLDPLGFGADGSTQSRAALRGPTYDQWAQQQPGLTPPAEAPQFDPGSYGNPSYHPASYGEVPDPNYAQAAQGWDGFDTAGLGPAQYGYDQNPNGGDAAYAVDQGAEYEVEEPRRRVRPLLIAAVLVGVIVVGGGAALLFGGSDSDTGTKTAALVTSSGDPMKTRPSNPGGRQFDHADSKIMGRLSEPSAAGAQSSSTDDPSGARKVTTLVVGRDGSIAPPSAQPPARPAPSVTVPGMTIIDGLGSDRPSNSGPTAAPGPSAATASNVKTVKSSPPAGAVRPAGSNAASDSDAGTNEGPIVVNAPPASAKPFVTAPPPSAKPVVIAKATPSTSRITTNAVPEPSQDDAPAAAPPPPKKTKKTVAAASGASASPSASSASTGGGTGWVAVLASVPASGNSRMDALKRFADMQQQYGEVLQNATPDVQEASVADKGTYHRLVAGPPGSKDQANQLCPRLKGAGYGESCWIKPY